MSENGLKEKKMATPAGKVAVVLLILLAAFLLTLPAAFVEKEPRPVPVAVPDWRGLMPGEGLPADEAAAGYLRARQYFEAAVRPALIDAGFFSAADMPGFDAGLYSGWRDRDQSRSAWLTERLWSFHPFPEIQAGLLEDLRDAAFSAEYRAARFTGMAASMAAAAETLPLEDSHAARYFSTRNYAEDAVWLAYFRHDPRVFGAYVSVPDPCSYSDEPVVSGVSPEELRVYAAKRDLAGRVLAVLFRDLREAETARLEQNRAEGLDGTDEYTWDWENSPPWEDDDVYGESAFGAILSLWQSHDDPAAYASGLNLLESGEGSPEIRYNAVPLAIRRPGLSPGEYAFWGRHQRDFDYLDSRIGSDPYYYGYILGLGSDLEVLLHDSLKARGIAMLASTADGPGVAIRPLDAPPALSAAEAKDPLYLMADTADALRDAPAHDMSRALPALENTAARFMEKQPVLLPLDLSREDDGALLRWYLAGNGAADRLVLFSASGGPEDLARHLGYVHFIWWPQTDRHKNTLPGSEANVALLRMGGGPFMHAILNAVNGEAASRFLGPISGLWYRIESVDADQWYAATPDAGLPRILSDDASPALYLTDPVNRAMTAHFLHSKNTKLARKFHDGYPAAVVAGESPQATYDYLRAERETLADYGVSDRQGQDRALELFWRFRNDAAATGALRRVFENDSLSARQRLEEARRAVGLSQEEL